MPLPAVDLLALAWFAAAWIGYARLADSTAWHAKSLSATVNRHRRAWLEKTVERDNRVADATLISNLMRSVSFLASTTMLILGGLVAMMGALDRIHDLLGQLPFVAVAGKDTQAVKLILLGLIFVYAFFTYTWSLRQFNYACILMGGAPTADAPAEEKAAFVERTARLHELAGHSFNGGLRAYYFGLATLCWFLHPVLYMAATALVVAMLYRREFRSKTLKTLVG